MKTFNKVLLSVVTATFLVACGGGSSSTSSTNGAETKKEQQGKVDLKKTYFLGKKFALKDASTGKPFMPEMMGDYFKFTEDGVETSKGTMTYEVVAGMLKLYGMPHDLELKGIKVEEKEGKIFVKSTKTGKEFYFEEIKEKKLTPPVENKLVFTKDELVGNTYAMYKGNGELFDTIGDITFNKDDTLTTTGKFKNFPLTYSITSNGGLEMTGFGVSTKVKKDDSSAKKIWIKNSSHGAEKEYYFLKK